MAVLIGSSDTGAYSVTTSTYSSSNGEFIYAMTALETGDVDTLFVNMNDFGIAANVRLLLRNSSGDLLGSGVIAAAGGTGVRSVAITPVAITQGQTYYIGFQPSSGAPRPYQNDTQSTIAYDNTSTYATPADPFNLPGNTDAWSLRQYHAWAEGDIAATDPSINPTGTTTSAAPGGAFTVNLSNMDGRTVESLELYDPVSGVSTAQSYTGTTSLTGTVTLGNLPYRSGMEWVVTLDNAAELTAEFEMVPAAGRSLTEIEADFDETDQSIGYGFDPAMEVGSQLEYATAALTVYPDALFYTDYEGSQVVNHWSPTDGEWYQETIITGDLPSTDSSGFTARGFTARGFTASGFTARGF